MFDETLVFSEKLLKDQIWQKFAQKVSFIQFYETGAAKPSMLDYDKQFSFSIFHPGSHREAVEVNKIYQLISTPSFAITDL